MSKEVGFHEERESASTLQRYTQRALVFSRVTWAGLRRYEPNIRYGEGLFAPVLACVVLIAAALPRYVCEVPL